MVLRIRMTVGRLIFGGGGIIFFILAIVSATLFTMFSNGKIRKALDLDYFRYGCITMPLCFLTFAVSCLVVATSQSRRLILLNQINLALQVPCFLLILHSNRSDEFSILSFSFLINFQF
jgi:hypothetical protein